MYNKYFVGRDMISAADKGKYKPVSRITLLLDDTNCITAGDDTGLELTASCPHATQTMVDTLLQSLKGYQYHAFEVADANLNPAAELGDGVTANGLYGVLSQLSDDGSGYSSFSATGEATLEDEYPAAGPLEQKVTRQFTETRSLITKTSEEIRLEVSNELQQLSSSIQISLDNISLKVEDNAKGLSQTVRLAADGLTITNASGSKLTIDGGQIKAASIETSAFKAGSITADKLSITGAITFGDLDSNTQSSINSAQNTASSAYNYAANAYSYAGNAYTLANSAYNLAAINTPPSYIKSTYIDSVSIQSPTIMGGTFIGNEFNVISESGGGSFNLYGKYGNYSIHALAIEYSAGTAPMTAFYSPSGGYASWNFDMTYMTGSISMGSGDIDFYINGAITSIRDMYERLEALERTS